MCAGQLHDPPDLVKLIDERDYPTACELIKRRLGSGSFVQKVQREFQQAAFRAADIHRHIYDLDSSIVASPNFDNIYETHASSVSAGSVIVKDHTSSDIASYLHGGDVRLILKTHGSANNPDEVIFTRFDYAEARTKYTLFYAILKALALTHTFLFIGCGIDDPDIRMLFEDIRFAHGRLPDHYMTVAEGSVADEILTVTSEMMHVSFLKYSQDNNHAALTSGLAALVKNVEDVRAQLRTTEKW
ncbi:SIR2 family protein [Xanthomonas sp. AmX2]|uniref:SIR2 family protein n=1 Tax=Xanthomonas sp. TaxID=29446 RepID=UPI001981EED4|nr:SIR2 family protein [Xanthomonas sp.]MBN6150800.1 SIR2 family protein [Xanthomonas sp.]